MTTEQREAIRQCELYVQAKATIQLVDEIDGKLAFKSCDTSAIDTVLSLIKEQDKQIDLMAFNLADYVMYYDYDKCRNPEMIRNKAEELKKYFERRVEDVKDKR